MIFNNPLYADLMGDAEMSALFAPDAEIAAMITVERALARAQARVGLVPADAAAALDRELAAVKLKSEDLSAGTKTAGVPVPALVAALRQRISPDAAHWLHWGATTHDIMDCALVLRLEQACAILDGRIGHQVTHLANLAEAHVGTPMAGRTRSQIATPISFGLRAAYWLQGLLDHRDALPALRAAIAKVQFGGASGSNSATAPHGAQIIHALADELGLQPAPPWHTNRTFVPNATGWCAALSGTAARIAGDVLLLARREIAELKLSGGGGSSTMPNKANPVSAEVIVALGRYAASLNTPSHLAMAHHEDRDSTAWMLEWIVLPQAFVCAAASLSNLHDMLNNMAPDGEAMARNLALDGSSALAEAASFALAAHMPRADAQTAVKEAARQTRETGSSLIDILDENLKIEGLKDQIAELALQGSGREIIDQIVARARQPG